MIKESERKKFWTMLTIWLMVAGGLGAVLPGAEAHVAEGVGESLQLYSHWTSTTPTIDGNVNPAGNLLEWADSYVREITLTDGAGTDVPTFVLLMNDNDYLYVAIAYQGANSAASNWVGLYFDEGNEATGVAYDGDHYTGSQSLTADNEHAVVVDRGLTTTDDMYWNGAGWVTDATDDFTAADAGMTPGGSNYYTWEVRVDIDNGLDAAGDSDLNVLSTDELGFCLRVGIAGIGTGTFYWDQTGDSFNDPTTATWSDIMLGVPTTDRNLFTTWARDGVPIVDGDISNDIYWEGAWAKDLVLTDFAGNNINSRILLTEDPTSGMIYVGLVVYDSSYDTNDYVVLYQERGAGGGPWDAVIDNGAENSVYLDGAGTWEDRYANDVGDNIDWTADDTIVPDNKDGAADAGYVIDGALSRWEFEIGIPYDPALPWLGDADYDNDFSSGDIIQFLLRFNQGGTDYFWDATTNVEDLAIDDGDGITNQALGWAYLQTGGPYLNIITPGDGGSVSGSNYQVFAYSDVPLAATTDWVGFKVEGDITWTSLSGPTGAGNDEWSITWDTTPYSDGQKTIVFRAIEGGIDLRQELTVNFANGGGGAPPTGVMITGPASGTQTGTFALQATASGASSVEIHVDGAFVDTMTPGAGSTYSYNLDTTLFPDGVHFVQINAVNANGEIRDSEIYTFENDAPDGSIEAPEANGDLVSGVYTFKAQATEHYDVTGVQFNFAGASLGGLGLKDAWYNPATGYWEYTVDTTLYGDEASTVDVRVTDQAGTTDISSPVRDFIVDNTPPSLTPVAPLDGEYLTVSPALLQVDATDPPFGLVGIPQYRANGGTWINMPFNGGSGHYEINWAFGALADGAHALEYRIQDDNGLLTYETVNVFVDSTDPAVAISQPLASQYVEGDLTFRIQASDAIGIDTTNLTVENTDTTTAYLSNVNTILQDGYYTFQVDTTSWPDGNYQADSAAMDLAERTKNATSIAFRVDNNAPTITINTPLDGATVSGNAYAMDVPVTEIFPDTANYSVDGSGWVDIATAWDTEILADGQHTVEFKARDLAGHVTTQTITVTVDNHDPTAGVVTPVTDQYIAGTWLFKATASDMVGISNVLITIRNTDTMADEVVNGTMSLINGLYQYEYDSTQLDDGNYTMAVWAHDVSGNTTQAAWVNFRIDNNAPDMTINAPTNGASVNGTYTMDVLVLETFPAGVEYSVDGTGWVDIATTWDTEILADGQHTVEFQATDLAGHVTTQTITVTVDNLGPSLDIILPIAGTYIEGTYTLQFLVTDIVGIDFVFLNITGPGGEYTVDNETATLVEGFYEYLLDTATLDDGTYTLTLWSCDLMGTAGMAGPITFNIDNTAPVVDITAPKDGDPVTANVGLTASLTEDFLRTLHFKVDNGAWIAMSTTPAYQHNWITSTVPDGWHTITVRAIDWIGNLEEDKVTILVDNGAPTVSVVSPVDGEYLSGVVTFQVSAWDAAGITTVQVDIGGTLHNAVYNTQTGYYEFVLDTTSLTNAAHTLDAEASDFFQQTPAGAITIYVDNAEPVVSITSPADGATVTGSVGLTVAVTETFIDTLQYRIDSGAWVAMPTSAPFTHNWATATIPDGWHTITVRAADKIGNVQEDQISILVDNTAPGVAIVSPQLDEFVDGTYSFQALITDVGGGVTAFFSINGTDYPLTYNTQNGLWEAIVDTTTIPDASHSADLTVDDTVAGHTVQTSRLFNLDNNAPTLTVISPADGAILEGEEVELNASAEDSGFTPTLEYSIDNGAWQAYNDTWNLTAVTDGAHTIHFRATDPAGHVSLKCVDVIVDNNAPVVSVASPAPDQYLEGIFTFQVSVQEAVSIDSVRLSFIATIITEYTMELNTQSGFYEYSLDMTTFADGDYQAMATARDSLRAGLSSLVDFHIDTTKPEFTIDAPAPGDFVEGELYIHIDTTGAEGPGGLLAYYSIDDGGWIPMAETASFEATLNLSTAGINDGAHTLSIKLVDSAGHEIIKEMPVYLDNNVPELYPVHLPNDNEHVTDAFTMKFDARDAVGIAKVTHDLEGTAQPIFLKLQTGFYELSLANLGLDDGTYTVNVVTEDNSGLTTTMSRSFVLDNTAPAMTVIAPAGGGVLKEKISFMFDVTDASDNAGDSEVYLSLDGGDWIQISYKDATSGYVHTWQTTAKDNGEHTYQLMTRDSLGNEKTYAPTSFTVDNFELIPFIVFLAVLVLLIVGMALALKGKKDTAPIVDDEPETLEQNRCCVCLGMIKDDGTAKICACGKHFHGSCMDRVDECPHCGESYKSGDEWSAETEDDAPAEEEVPAEEEEEEEEEERVAEDVEMAPEEPATESWEAPVESTDADIPEEETESTDVTDEEFPVPTEETLESDTQETAKDAAVEDTQPETESWEQPAEEVATGEAAVEDAQPETESWEQPAEEGTTEEAVTEDAQEDTPSWEQPAEEGTSEETVTDTESGEQTQDAETGEVTEDVATEEQPAETSEDSPAEIDSDAAKKEAKKLRKKLKKGKITQEEFDARMAELGIQE